MNDRLKPITTAPTDSHAAPADAALPPGLRLGAFEIQRVIARSSSTVVYLAIDHGLALKVAIQEFLPARFARRDAGLQLRAAEPWHENVLARGLRAFIDESRLLARCEHPGLVRVNQLFEAFGSAYRVMPFYDGERLIDVRRDTDRPLEEAALRKLLDALLGAAEALHRAGHVHGNITPTNILLLADHRPLLLSPGAAGREVGTDLVDTLMATLEITSGASRTPGAAAAGAPATGAARDLYAIAEIGRFCITGEPPPPAGTVRSREPLAKVLASELAPEARPHYGAALLGTLDAALSDQVEDRPLTAAQFRDWLERGVPGGALRVSWRGAPGTAVGAAPSRPATASTAAPASTAPPWTTPVSPAGAPASAASSTNASTNSSMNPATPAAFGPFGSAHATTPAPLPSPPSRGPAAPDPAMRPPTPEAPADGFQRADEPASPWSEADRIEPMVAEPPAWVPPPMPQRLARPASTRAGRYKALLVTALTVSAVAVLAVATGWWNLAPEIQFDPVAQRSGVPPAPPQAAGPVATGDPAAAPRTEPGGDVPPSPLPTLDTEARAATTPGPDAPAAASASAAAASTPLPAPPAEPASTAVAATAGPGTGETPAAPPAGAPTDSSARPVRRSATEGPGPRGACLGRTEFALYRCMQQQCETRRWSAHPQCVKLRRDDEVE